MNQDYLWDKTGPPDVEIERLERILEPLRYKQRPFQMPSVKQIEGKRSWVPLLAIAATIMIAVFGAGLWLRLKQPLTGEIARLPLPVDALPIAHAEETALPVKTAQLPKRQPVRHTSIALTRERAKERYEATVAKEQLMLALRLASSKLNQAQRKTRNVPAIIRNQHKVG
jgi:hypothetical protein